MMGRLPLRSRRPSAQRGKARRELDAPKKNVRSRSQSFVCVCSPPSVHHILLETMMYVRRLISCSETCERIIISGHVPPLSFSSIFSPFFQKTTATRILSRYPRLSNLRPLMNGTRPLTPSNLFHVFRYVCAILANPDGLKCGAKTKDTFQMAANESIADSCRYVNG